MNKRGIFFIIDVIIAFLILAVGFLIIFSVYLNEPITPQPYLFAQDASLFLTKTTFGEVYSNYTSSLISAGTVDESDLISEYIAKLCDANDQAHFGKLMNATLLSILPGYLSYAVRVINETSPPYSTYCLDSHSSLERYNSSQVVSSAHMIIFGGNKTYVLEVEVW